AKRKELKQWHNSLNNLNRELEQALGISISSEYKIVIEETNYQTNQQQTTVNSQSKSQSKTVYSYSGKGVKEDVGTFKTSPIPKKETYKKEDVEKKFIDWEIDEEIARMKSEMYSSGFKENSKNRQQAKVNQPLSEKDKVIHAYNILGLKTDASPEKIKQNYKKLVKKWHPDLFINQPRKLIEAKEKIRLINKAYSLLTQNHYPHL
ncbi:MAG: J domain-containing protein, partial [Cyanobacteria bacterium J06632_19]